MPKYSDPVRRRTLQILADVFVLMDAELDPELQFDSDRFLFLIERRQQLGRDRNSLCGVAREPPLIAGVL